MDYSRGDYNNHRGAVGCVDVGRGGDVNIYNLRILELSLKTRIAKDKSLLTFETPGGLSLVPMARIQANETTLQEFYKIFKDELKDNTCTVSISFIIRAMEADGIC